ncbi:hypothetical protein [Biostraticola tofi]|uniref:Uncharacterized protein n=1 Tax=Biostraticola tofi TaxID=466109 RepID=A0A4R3YGM1_9GAMM|nr:hypothetical protein [Biostraticola tofi]TCV91092.1 hypothetical protein EDC52_1222 [Biostraticola tofi]
MNNFLFFDEMKDIFLDLLSHKSDLPIDIDDLSINYNRSLEELLIKQLTLLHLKTKLLALAKNNDDELAMQSALLRLRTHAMSLSSFFDNIVEDTEVILRTGTWPEFPEDYKIPNHYNESEFK